MANFETFRRELVALKSEPFVTIQKRGTISLNRSAYSALGEPKAVELLYDRQRRIVGLHPVDLASDNAYQVRMTSPSGPYVISAMAFTKFYDLDLSVTKRWSAYVDEDVLCVDLTVEGVAVTSNRARSGRRSTRKS